MGAALNGPAAACSEVSTAAGCSWVRALHHLLETELPWSCFPAAELLRLIQIYFSRKKKKHHHQFPGTLVFLPPNTANATGVKITSCNLSMAL